MKMEEEIYVDDDGESFELCVRVWYWFTWNDDGEKVISTGMDTWRDGIGWGSVWRSWSRASSHENSDCETNKAVGHVGPVRDDTFSMIFRTAFFLICPCFST